MRLWKRSMAGKTLVSMVTMLATFGVTAKVEIAGPFADGAVLQRGMKVPVWGTAEPEENVTVSFAGQRMSAKADEEGLWRVDLAPLEASAEGRTLTVTGDKSESFTEAKDVLVGEVWFCSGQSNVGVPIVGGNPRFRDGKGFMRAQMTMKPRVRFCNQCDWKTSPEPKRTCPRKPEWKTFTPENLCEDSSFSAVGVYFALELHNALDVPIGIVGAYWGGTRIEPWIPKSGFESVPETRRYAEEKVLSAEEYEAMPKERRTHSRIQDQPRVLWNEMVAPWTPYAMRGFIWYQGCANSGEGLRYSKKMHALYNGWAKEFENPGLRIRFVQLAPWWSTGIAAIQMGQAKFAAEEPNAKMAVINDKGNVNDIHPNDKETVGQRLALLALKYDYGFDSLRADSPTVRTARVDGGNVVVELDHAQSLYIYNPDKSLKAGLEICGADGEWKPGEIRNLSGTQGDIDGVRLVVGADGVPAPRKLRYLHSRPWFGCIYNEANLPLGAFEVEAKPDAAGPVRGDGMIPFLAITGKPTEAEVRAKVAAIHAHGIESFLIYARSGLELEYMGEEWLKLNEWFCDEAEKCGMKVWLYDEYNWPSGTCKGRVPNENDAWRYAEYGVYRNPDGTYRWTSALAPAGWVNVCEPDAVARFIELTHEVYAKRLSRWFANKTILGIFTDEPGHPTSVTFPDGKPLVSFRKYSGLDDEYRAATGRELKGDVEKWLETKKGDVWSACLGLMGKRFRSAYFDQLRKWCDAHGILLTGHMICENDIYGSVRYNGNPILCLRGESLPGMDEISTAYGVDARPPIEWVTYNVARQAVLHRGNGGLAELFACGPADHVPATMRFVMWMCALHGIDHYISCMDVMDEKGLVEKHGYLAPLGPIHPWYEKYACVFADESRIAAAWARKTVAEREVAVRYPNRTAAQLAFCGRTKATPGPNLYGLLQTLEQNQFTCRLVDEDETTDIPLVFSCGADGRFAEERTGKADLTAADALALCRKRLTPTFCVLEQDGTLATDLLTRTFSDGSSAVLNLRAFSDRVLLAERDGKRTSFGLPARGIVRFDSGTLPEVPKLPTAVRSLADVEWELSLSAPNIRRVNFDEAKQGSLTVASPLKNVRIVTRECAMSYAVTGSGRPIGLNEQPAKGDTVIRHVAEPYAFEMDGVKVEATEPCSSLRPCCNPLYRQTAPFDLLAGEHRFAIVSGEADSNFFLPAFFVTGDFVVFNGVLMTRPQKKVKMGSLASNGLGDFTGTATWSAEVTVPTSAKVRLRLATGGRVTRVVLAGRDLGVRAWAPFEWEIQDDLVGKAGRLEIAVSTSVQPMLGDVDAGKWDMRFWNAVNGPDGPCGLLAADWIESRE